jgi:thiamine monophosphate kinase
VRIELDLGAIPLHSDMGHEPLDPRHAAGHGEDYELLFTVGGCVDCGRIPSSIHGNAGATAITLIGRVVEAQPGRPICVGINTTGKGKEEIDLACAGWDH